jgi:hypothetical protein
LIGLSRRQYSPRCRRNFTFKTGDRSLNHRRLQP